MNWGGTILDVARTESFYFIFNGKNSGCFSDKAVRDYDDSNDFHLIFPMICVRQSDGIVYFTRHAALYAIIVVDIRSTFPRFGNIIFTVLGIARWCAKCFNYSNRVVIVIVTLLLVF